MRKKHNNRILGRSAQHRSYLLKNLTRSLLMHGSIVTTEAKAKELRRHVEPLITEAKSEMTLARRRNLLSKLNDSGQLSQLIDFAQIHKDRPGGYLRLTHLPQRRSDNAPEVRVDVITESVQK